MKVWRVYLNGMDFGTDYYNLERAREVKAQYLATFPHNRYYIRCADDGYPWSDKTCHYDGRVFVNHYDKQAHQWTCKGGKA